MMPCCWRYVQAVPLCATQLSGCSHRWWWSVPQAFPVLGLAAKAQTKRQTPLAGAPGRTLSRQAPPPHQPWWPCPAVRRVPSPVQAAPLWWGGQMLLAPRAARREGGGLACLGAAQQGLPACPQQQMQLPAGELVLAPVLPPFSWLSQGPPSLRSPRQGAWREPAAAQLLQPRQTPARWLQPAHLLQAAWQQPLPAPELVPLQRGGLVSRWWGVGAALPREQLRPDRLFLMQRKPPAPRAKAHAPRLTAQVATSLQAVQPGPRLPGDGGGPLHSILLAWTPASLPPCPWQAEQCERRQQEKGRWDLPR